MTKRARTTLRLLLMLSVLLPAGSSALATQAPSQDGVWVGAEDGHWTQTTVSISGDTLVFVDIRSVIVGTITQPLGGANGEWDLVVTAMLDRRGKSHLGQQAGPLTSKVSSSIAGRTLKLCGTAPGSKTPRPKLELAPGEHRAKGVRCFNLHNVTPPPTPPGPKIDECLSACLRQNQMRAVGPEVIEADCRRHCGASDAP